MTDEGRTIQVAVTGEEQVGPERPEPGADSLIGNRYRVHRRIGKGGMGEVMLARDEQVGREVAIKRMRAANPSQRAIARFLREASVQGRLEHPALVPVHEIGRDSDGLPFFVMKRVTGTPLIKLIEDQTFVLQRVLRALVEVCWCIELAHVRGIIHRDLKPDNIMLGNFGEVYVLDWGVAKVFGEEDVWSDVGSGSGSGVHATAAGTASGTPGYMAPEQERGSADIDGRADVYTLGCLLFDLLAGETLHPRGFQGLESALAKKPVPGAIELANTVIVSAVARLVSPILIAPGVAALLAMAMAMTPRFSWLSSVWSVAGFMVVGVIAPLVAERWGQVSATMRVDANGMCFFPAMIGPHETPAVAVAALYAIRQIAYS